MIEKIKSPLDLKVGNYKGTEFDIIPADTFVMVCRKINELCDVVNEQQKDYDNVCVYVGEQKLKTPAENVQDKFEEQRKWVGCLCRFWDTNIGENVWGILGGIDFSENEKYPYWCDQLQEQYQNCEPVKPDDDIIYKGGDNDNPAN